MPESKKGKNYVICEVKGTVAEIVFGHGEGKEKAAVKQCTDKGGKATVKRTKAQKARLAEKEGGKKETTEAQQ